MITWIKPSGVELETNDFPATIAAAESLGWKRKGEEEKPKRGRPPKTVEEQSPDEGDE